MIWIVCGTETPLNLLYVTKKEGWRTMRATRHPLAQAYYEHNMDARRQNSEVVNMMFSNMDRYVHGSCNLKCSPLERASNHDLRGHSSWPD